MYPTSRTYTPRIIITLAISSVLMSSSLLASVSMDAESPNNNARSDFSELTSELDIATQIRPQVLEIRSMAFAPESNYMRGSKQGRMATTATIDSEGAIQAVESFLLPN